MMSDDDGMQCVQPRGRWWQTCDCKGMRWTCKGCKRFVPFCNGGHSDDAILDDLCDQCAVVVMAQRRDRGEPEVQRTAGMLRAEGAPEGQQKVLPTE